MDKVTLYPTAFAVYDPQKQCGGFSDAGALSRAFKPVNGHFFCVTQDSEFAYRTSSTSKPIDDPALTSKLNSRFFDEAILKSKLISGMRITKREIAGHIVANDNFFIEIQNLGRPEIGFVIPCDVKGHSATEQAQFVVDAENLPSFIDFYVDDDDRGVVIEEIGPEAVAFRLRWGL